jgi:tRNA A37 threonylcarbamoyladenosine modification protein TsaB
LVVTAAPWLNLLQRTEPHGQLCALIAAGRGRYNWAFFDGSDDVSLWSPGVADHQGGTLTELIETLQGKSATPIWLAGEIDNTLTNAVAAITHVVTLDTISSWRRAGQLARVADLHLQTGRSDDLATLQPLYLRNP